MDITADRRGGVGREGVEWGGTFYGEINGARRTFNSLKLVMSEQVQPGSRRPAPPPPAAPRYSCVLVWRMVCTYQ